MRIIHRIAAIAATAAVGVGFAAGTAGADVAFAPGSVTGTTDSTQAGAHADFHTGFELALGANDRPTGTVKDLDVDLPRGFVGNPQATPTCAPSLVQQGGCPIETAVGVATFDLMTPDGNRFGEATKLIYNVTPRADQPAALMFSALIFPVRLDTTVRSNGEYGLRASVRNLTEAYPLLYAKIDLWGVPADRQGPGGVMTYDGEVGGPRPGAERIPFLTNPTACTGSPIETTYAVRGWVGASPAPVTALGQTLTGCGDLPFAPTVDVQPDSRQAGAPSGYDVDVTVPQSDDPDTPATGHLKDAVVTLPQGVSISPPGANGLGACTDEQLRLGSDAADECPNDAKIGTVDIDTPLLASPLEGAIYLGSQKSKDPASGDMYRLFLTASGSGVRIKLRGAIKADPKTGQLTASFVDNPQLPFSRLSLKFKGGDRAPLVNPPTCGTKTTDATLTSWSGKSVGTTDEFAIDQGCPDKPGFNPGFTAGTVTPLAGAFSPFTMSVYRQDGEQDLSKIHLDLPSGLLGALGSVPVCAEAQAAAGTCDPSTRLGSTTVSVGTGGKPYSLGGTVSLGGPYKGAPFSLSIAVPAKAGPLDLGMVVVRSPLVIDANKGKVFAPADDLPRIVGGVPLKFRMVNITLDRPNFMWNATTCERQVIGARFESTAGAVAAPSVPYQAQGCDRLLLNPSLTMSYGTKSELKKGKHPSLTAELSQSFRQAGLKKVAVTLPLTSSLDAKNAKALCTPEQFAARACPEASIVGRASARTPALHDELTGPVYFVEGTRVTATGAIAKTTPKLWLKLQGEGVPLDLVASSTFVGKAPNQRLVATFDEIPDAPISSFKLQIDGGENGILGAPRDPCTSDRVASARFDGQNGDRRVRNVTIAAPDCGVRATATASSSRVQLRVVNIGAGKVKVSGKGVKARTRTLKSGKAATLTAALTSKTRQQVAAGKTVKLRLKVSWTPKGSKKAKTATQTVTIKGAASRAKARTAR